MNGPGASLPPTTARVEQHTDPAVNADIRQATQQRLEGLYAADAPALSARLAALDTESDIERLLQTNAGVLATSGIVLAVLVDRRFAWLSAAVFGFMGWHALQGWCPPLPLMRRLGVRTVREIDTERQALKALRSDFAGVPAAGEASPAERVRAALAAVDR